MGLPVVSPGLGPNIYLAHYKAWGKPGFLNSVYSALPSVANTISMVVLPFEHLFPHVGPGQRRCLLSGASPVCPQGSCCVILVPQEALVLCSAFLVWLQVQLESQCSLR